MKKIGLFYGTGTAKTAAIAKKIQEAFGNAEIETIAVENATGKDFEAYDYLILGVSTWFDGELPTYWDELIPELNSLNLKDKKIALFGLGDQENYPDNFADGVGILAETFETGKAKIVGLTSSKDYNFNQSKALKNNKFLGLILDMENQPDKTDVRIKSWVEELKKEFM